MFWYGVVLEEICEVFDDSVFPIGGTVESAAFFKYPPDFTKTFRKVRHMIKHHIGNRDIKRIVRKGDILNVDDLPYDVVLTEYGSQILSEIKDLENKWAEIAGCNIEELRKIALNTFDISYKFKKSQKYQF